MAATAGSAPTEYPTAASMAASVTRGLIRWAWLPIPAILIALLALWVAGLTTPHEHILLMAGLNLVCSLLASLLIAYLMARSFMIRGAPGLLMVGCGVMIWGTAALAGITAGLIGPSGDDFINVTMTTHNSAVLLSGLCHLAGTLMVWRVRGTVRATGAALAVGYVGALGVVGLISLAALGHVTPTFFVQSSGGTLVRWCVLGSATGLFAVTAGLLAAMNRRTPSPFLFWYSIALGLIATGLLGIMIEKVHGGVLSWTARGAQMLSGLYMLAAAMASVRENRVWGIALETALRQSEQRYRQLFESMTEGFALHEIVTDEQGRPRDYRFLDVNPAFERLTGLEHANLIGRRVLEVLPQTEAHWIENFGRVALSGEPVRFENYSASLGRWYGVYAYRPAQEQFAVLVSDITDRKRAEQQLVRTATELARSNADLQQFAYAASHDLQEPLRVIRGFLNLLDERFPQAVDAKAKEWMTHVREAAGRMSRLIADLLAFTRVDRQAAQFEPVSLRDAADEATANLRAAMAESNAQVTIGQMPTVRADRAQMTLLLQNLIGNAIKFRQPSVRPVVEVGARREAGDWVVSVRDNGIGIDPQHFERIFVIFQRLHTRGDHPGTGIGLALCKRIVERHGGRLWVQSQPGEGSTFAFTMPDLAPVADSATT